MRLSEFKKSSVEIDPIIEEAKEAHNDDQFPEGICNSAKQNIDYIKLLQLFGISMMNNEELMKNFIKYPSTQDKSRGEVAHMKLSIWDKLGIEQKVIDQVLARLLVSNWSVNSIAAKYWVSVQAVQYIIQSFNKDIIREHKKNKGIKRKRMNKITSKHIDLVKEYMKANSGKLIKLNKLWMHINQNTEIEHLSIWSMRYILNNKLDYSYKKADVTHVQSEKPEKVRLLIESTVITKMLEQQEYELIYFDEFSFNTWKANFRNWVNKGK